MQTHLGLQTALTHLEPREPSSRSGSAARKSPCRLARLLDKHAREAGDRLERPACKDFIYFVVVPHSPARAGALHDHNVAGEVCKHIEHESVSYLGIWMTTDLGPIGHASIINGGGPCRQQQQPDGHASAWMARSSEAVQRKVGA